jgi:hypothetical protein
MPVGEWSSVSGRGKARLTICPIVNPVHREIKGLQLEILRGFKKLYPASGLPDGIIWPAILNPEQRNKRECSLRFSVIDKKYLEEGALVISG